MSPALLALSVCTFALGFAEFVAISLVPSIAGSTGLRVGSVGFMVGIYAIGVSIGAPVLSALLANAPRRKVLTTGMLVFAMANLLTATTASLPILLGSRLVAGLMHGLVLALAASTAAAAAGQERSGAAIATVFGGLTLALLVGVPLGTLAGGTFRWQDVFLAIAGIGGFGAVALMFFAPLTATKDSPGGAASIWSTVSDLRTLHPVLITAFTYAGSFTGFTYISVLLENLTGMSAAGVTGMFVLYGASAATGNALGGRFVDRFGSRFAILSVIAGLAIALVLAWTGAGSAGVMAIAMVVWGLASFAAVPVLQKTVLVAAQQNTRGSPELASGMNIAAFNVGIAVGSSLGGLASNVSPLAPMATGLGPLVLAMAFAFFLRKAQARRPSLTSPITQQGT